MKKGKRLIKRAISLLLVLLFSINSFAAIVSDNDGSAFITKAEFDSLKNDFQAQIDNYNTSIDSRIDGAIAAYLGGIRMNNWTSQNMIGYKGVDGILSVSGRDDMEWKNGRMYGTLVVESSRQRQLAQAKTGTMRLEGNTPKSVGESNPFWELCIGNVEYQNAQAGWLGYSKCVNGFYFIDASITPVTQMSSMTWSDDVVSSWWMQQGQGVRANSNVDLGTKAAGDNENRVIHFGMASSQTATSFTNGFQICRGGAFLDREIKETKYKNIILTPASLTENRFSNVDEIRDWCNDEVDGTFNKLSDHGTGSTNGYIGSLCSSYSCQIVRFNSASSTAATSYTPTVKNNTSATSTITYANVYLGFVKPITNYNKLWTYDYDSYIEDMLDCDSGMDYAIYTDPATSKKTKHLWISAGLPITKVEKNHNVKIKLDFKQEDTNGDGIIDSKDTVQNYNVWFKWGAFKNNTDPKDDNVIKKDVKLSNGQSVNYNETNKYWVVKNGSTVIVPKNNSDGYLFMKWSKENTTKGGGTFIGTSQIQIQKDE